VVQDGVNGLLVPPGDARSLADALGKLLQDWELRARMGAAGRTRVEKRFADKSINAQTLEVYRSLIQPLE
jgi:glycosyltransferase involved in cell wall biosynthesis